MKKALVKKQPAKKNQALTLAQVDAESQIGIFQHMQQKLNELKETQQHLKHITAAIGKSKPTPQQVGNLAKSLGLEMNEVQKVEASKLGSNELIAHSIANRVLAQVHSGTSKDKLISDLNQTKSALNTAKEAYYKKDPQSIALLQLDESANTSTEDQIILEDADDSTLASLQVEDQSILSSPEENEFEVHQLD